jgi:lipopolysaccharide transport system permease protein
MEDSEFDLIIDPSKPNLQYWDDLWHYRELLYILTWRDILVRYKQAVIGIAWTIIRPLLTMLAFVLVFNQVAKLESGNVPYAITVLVALLPWQFFSTSLSDASNSFIANSNLISKVYFPRMIVPLSSVAVCFIDFIISCFLLIALLIYYRFVPSSNIVFLPLYIFILILISLGSGLCLSALNVKYRDFRYVVPFIIQFGLYVSPVGFSSDMIPNEWRFLYSINPMVGIIDGFRWCVLGTKASFYWPGFAISLLLIIVLLIIGITYFRKTEKGFADKI